MLHIPTIIIKPLMVYKPHIYTKDNKITSILNEEGKIYIWDIYIYSDNTETKVGSGIPNKVLVDYKK